jgi:hypothetical protein
MPTNRILGFYNTYIKEKIEAPDARPATIRDTVDMFEKRGPME